MKCKSCKNEIPDGSIFCMYCGEKQIREKKKKDEIKVPKPVQLPSGAWRIQLKAEGQSVTEATAELCVTKAKAIRAGFAEAKAKAPKLTLYDGIGKYISSNDAVLSPSTLRGYEEIRRNRFKAYQEKDVSSVDWQKAINEEAQMCSPKTIKNAWGLAARVMRYNGLPVPDVRLPQRVSKELPWLNYKQIEIFLQAIYNQPCEFGALFALHSLRRSELMAITPSKIKDNKILVEGADIVGVNNERIHKDTNKNNSSRRVVPIMIPRLQQLIADSGNKDDEPYVTVHINSLHGQINRVCEKSGLPQVGVHGLRRSFASLAYHLGWQERQTMAVGGWSDWQTMHKIYIKLDETEISNAANTMKDFYNFPTKFPTK